MNRAELYAHRAEIAALCAAYGVVGLWVFGSTARDDSSPASDVDLLYVRGGAGPRGLGFFGLQDALEELLGVPVDLVPRDGLHWAIRERVLDEAEELYAA
jgi:hypothetical protein